MVAGGAASAIEVCVEGQQQEGWRLVVEGQGWASEGMEEPCRVEATGTAGRLVLKRAGTQF